MVCSKDVWRVLVMATVVVALATSHDSQAENLACEKGGFSPTKPSAPTQQYDLSSGGLKMCEMFAGSTRIAMDKMRDLVANKGNGTANAQNSSWECTRDQGGSTCTYKYKNRFPGAKGCSANPSMDPLGWGRQGQWTIPNVEATETYRCQIYTRIDGRQYVAYYLQSLELVKIGIDVSTQSYGGQQFCKQSAWVQSIEQYSYAFCPKTGFVYPVYSRKFDGLGMSKPQGAVYPSNPKVLQPCCDQSVSYLTDSYNPCSFTNGSETKSEPVNFAEFREKWDWNAK